MSLTTRSLATHLNVTGSHVPEALKTGGIPKSDRCTGVGAGSEKGRITFHYPLCHISPQSPLSEWSPSSHSPFKSPPCTDSLSHFPNTLSFRLLGRYTKARSHSNKHRGLHRMQDLKRKTAMYLIPQVCLSLSLMILGIWGTPR